MQDIGERTAANRGWSTMELMVAMAIVSTGLLVMLQQLSLSYRETEASDHRAFAYQKAAALLQEVQNSIDRSQIVTPDDLQALVDPDFNPSLTTRTDAQGALLAPGHPMSGNVQRLGAWLWGRKLSFSPHTQAGMYYARAQVSRRTDQGGWQHEATQSQLISLLPATDAPAQTFEIYALALASAPSLLATDLAQLRTEFTTAIKALEQDSRVRFKTYWITRLGYGRDQSYTPYVNGAVTTTGAAPWAYWLPGLLGGTQTGKTLYHSGLLGAAHRTEIGLVNGYGSQNTLPIAIADRWNHCLRQPTAQRLFDARVDAGAENANEPPLQLLLEQMQRTPERFRNAIFVNLHGSALPVPPLRNYSDAARDPATWPGVRVVTHPARLQTPRDPNGDGSHADSEDLELRVHAYKENPATGPAVLDAPITLQIFAPLDLSTAINAGIESTLYVHRLIGGVDPETGLTTGGLHAYHAFDSAEGLAPGIAGRPFEMHYTAGFVGGDDPYTWIRLHNTPVVSPSVAQQGLPATARLYGLEYVPSPVSATGFTIDLATSSTDPNQPKNTARWRIRLPKRLLNSGLLGNQDRTVRVLTRIGTDLGSGQRWPTPNAPGNLSETWAWWTRSREAVPFTERAQFLGDPRHQPYLDCTGFAGGGFPHAYNWHFDDLRSTPANATGQWPCLDPNRLKDGFGASSRADAPRLLQLWRESLQACGGVLVNTAGAIASQVLLGGEIATVGTHAGVDVIGIDLHGAYRGITSTVALNTISVPEKDKDGVHGEHALRATVSNWWAKPWLGELCPDSEHAGWVTSGNLPLPAFRWQQMHTPALPDLPNGTQFMAAGATVGDDGSLLLVNCGTPNATYRHASINSTAIGAPNQNAIAIAQACTTFSFNLASGRPFRLQATVTAVPPAFNFTDTYPRGTAVLLEDHLVADGNPAVGIVAFGVEPTRRGFLVPLGVTPLAGHIPNVLRQALMSALRAQHVAGHPTQPTRIRQVALPTLTEPPTQQVFDNPSVITLRWKTDWLRWDTQRYASTYPSNFAESESDLVYNVMVSSDLGVTWTNVVTNAPTTPEMVPMSRMALVNDVTAGNESLVVATPASSWPSGEYLFRVEARSLARQPHFGWHQVRVLIRRGGA